MADSQNRHMDTAPIQLEVQSHPKNLSEIRRVLTETVRETTLSETEQGSIILAVDEACSNIIRHGYGNDHSQTIRVNILRTVSKLEITIEDKGIAFDVDEIEKRDVHEVKPGGLGLYIITEIMDDVTYSRSEKGVNQIHMIKSL